MPHEWNLSDIYTGFDDPALARDFAALATWAKDMEGTAAALQSMADVATLVRQLEQYTAVLDRLESFSYFIFSTDTAHAQAQKYLYQLDALNAETSRAQVRLAAFLAGCEAGDFDALIAQHGLGDYAYRLGHMAREHTHMMSENEETLAAHLANTGSAAWNMLQNRLVSQLTCQYADPTQDGAVRTIGINECRNLAYSPHAAVRRVAYEAELAAYPHMAESSAAALNAIKGEVNLLCKLRNFASPLARTLFDSAMTQKTLDALFAAIDANVGAFRGYLKAKARYLARTTGGEAGGQNGLPFYDLFAPVGDASGTEYTWEQAQKFVIDNFAKFSPAMADVARQSFDKNWIDVLPREGKVSGAYCGDIYAVKQFRILLNFGGSLGDAITLAHELGHGYHAMQIMQEGILNTDYPMPLAETASTFCEMIVTHAALGTMGDDEKLPLLENSLQDATQVILDIYSRFLFEQHVFNTRQDHPLSVDELKEAMLQAQRTAYGDGLDADKLHPYMWAIKPHYYYAGASYYNFPYAFGHLLASGLYKIYEADPAAFGAKYDAFLRAAGKMPIAESCALLGIDVEDVAFWNGALDVIKESIKEFETLTKEDK